MNRVKQISASLVFVLLTVIQSECLAQDAKADIDFVMQSNLFPAQDSKDMQISFEFWVTDLFVNAGLDYDINLRLVSPEDFIQKNYNVEKTFMVVVSSINYLKARKDRFLEPLLFTAEDTMQVYVIAAQSKYTNLEQLEGKRIALTETGFGEIADFWLDHIIEDNYDKEKNSFFSYVDSVETDSKCINSVFFNKNDACVIREDVYRLACELNPQVKQRISIIKRSDNLLHSIMCLTGKFNSTERDKFIKAVMNVQNTERGKQILNLFKRTKLFEFKEKYLQNIKRILDNSEVVIKK